MTKGNITLIHKDLLKGTARKKLQNYNMLTNDEENTTGTNKRIYLLLTNKS